MKKTFTKILLLSCSLLLVACSNQTEEPVDVATGASPTSEKPVNENGLPIIEDPVTRTETLLHTVVQMQVYHEGTEEIIQEAVDYMVEMEAQLSTDLKGSDIYQINENAGIKPVKIKVETFDIIERAIEIAQESDGLFDISIGSLTNLWQIGSEDARVPTKEEIEEAISLIDYEKIILDKENMTVMLEEEGMALELGGISKGYIGSGVVDILEENNITTAIVNLGGNVIVMGTSPKSDQGWNVGVQDPDEVRGEIVGTQRVKNAAIVTSGIYERYLEVDGHKYHHIMDPRTGYPLDNEISGVTVFAPTSFDGDSYSTALFLMGIDQGIEFINSKEGFEVAYIDKDGGVHLSDGIKDSFELTNEEYYIVNE
ncbi:FAD:protein FMN transferase [Aerococcaceae bacterium WGS1372]